MKDCGFSDTCGLTVRTSELPAPPACEVAGPRSVRVDRIGQPRNDEMSQGGYSKKLETLSERTVLDTQRRQSCRKDPILMKLAGWKEGTFRPPKPSRFFL